MGNHMKIMSWNVNGIRARNGEITEIRSEIHSDILALQATEIPKNCPWKVTDFIV